MATYIPGITDYIPQIQPFRPDYNFLGNMLQTKQNRYDQSYNEISSLYGSLLNSPMLRDSNIQRRDAFFKAIEQDIKKISTMDLSLEQNVDAAKKIFQPFYEDKNMVNDMVKTKKYYNQLSKAESFKNCTDPDKCGGQYWEQGVRELHYKAEEFRNMSDQDALNFNMPSFTPYYNWQKDAIKVAKDAGLNVSMDHNNGQWIVTQKNGELVQGGLYGLFQSVYGQDPRVASNYSTDSYVMRKDFSKQYAMDYGSEEAAETKYINDTLAEYNNRFVKVKEDIQDSLSNLNGRKTQLAEKQAKEGLLPEELEILQNIVQKAEQIENVNKSLDTTNNTVQNEHLTDINALRSKADTARAFLMSDTDMQNMAKTLSLKDASIKMEANPYAMATHNANLQLRNSKTMAGINHAYSLEKMAAQLKMNMSMEDYKYALKQGFMEKDIRRATVLADDPGATACITKEDPTAAYKRNVLMGAERKAVAQSKDVDFLYDLFNTASSAADKNPGAQTYLRNTFGKNWPQIKTKDDMLKALTQNKKAVEEVFDQSIQSLSTKKNPYADTNWAQNFINTRGKEIEAIKEQNEASRAIIGFNARNNRFIADKIKASGNVKGQEVYKDADLLLTPAGFVRDEPTPPGEFVAAYIKRNHPEAVVFDAQGRFMETPAFNKAAKNAMAAYGALKDKFYEEYNNTPNMSFDQGAGLTGSGGVTSVPVKYSDVNASILNPASPAARARNILSTVSDSRSYSVVLGEPTPDAISGGGSEELKPLIDAIRSDMNIATQSKKPLYFDFVERGITANNPNVSSATFYLKPEALAKYVGTKNNPGPYWDYKDKLASGISVVYDNKMVNTPTTQSMKYTPLEEIVKTTGKTYDSFPNAGTVHLSYDRNTGDYILDFTAKQFDRTTGKTIETKKRDSFKTDDLYGLQNNLLNILDKAQQHNLSAADQWLKEQKANGKQ